MENMHTDIAYNLKALLTSRFLLFFFHSFFATKSEQCFFFFCNKAAQVHQGQLFPDWLMSTNPALKKHQLS